MRFGSPTFLVMKPLVALLVVTLVAVIPAWLNANPAIGSIDAHIVNLRNSRGQVICTLFTPADKFPDQSHKGMTMAVPIQDKHATCSFKNLPDGDYAIVA